MDEKKFFDYMDTKHAELIEGIAKIIDLIGIKQVTTTFADHSEKQPRESSGKPMPETKGGYTVSKYPCKRCGGIITWDNYSKEAGGQNYPDHLDEDGNILEGGCPDWNK